MESVFITLGSLTTDSATNGGGGARQVQNVLLDIPGYVNADVTLFIWALQMYEGGFALFLILLMSFVFCLFFFSPERMKRGAKSSRFQFYHTAVSGTEAFNIVHHSDSLF